tara:strand:- start:487 stop:984 length:498 start_codon:yes stop_codon:yes gene_type:complete
MDYLLWLEDTPFSIWIRESGPAFFGSLILHSVAMGFVVGVHVSMNLRILGMAPGIPLSLMRRFFPVFWVGLVFVSLSGVLLLIAYPAKALTNPVFYLKLSAIVTALFITKSLAKGVLQDPSYDAERAPRKARVLATVSIFLWAGAVTSGRFLAYTYKILMASHGF